MIAEVRLEAGAVLAKAFWTSDPTFSFQTALLSWSVFRAVNTMIVSLLLDLSLTF